MSANIDTIRSFIVLNFYVPEGMTLVDDASLLDLGIVDSTGVLEITAFLEGEYGIVIDDDEILPENLDSIACIADFVNRKQAASSAA